MYGIPNMKLDKQQVVQRRVELMEAEGVDLRHQLRGRQGLPGRQAARGVRRHRPLRRRDAAARSARSRAATSRASTSRWSSCTPTPRACSTAITPTASTSRAKDKDVIVIGGGDTGTDCVGTSLRHGCKSLVQFEILPQPPAGRAPPTTPGRSGPRSTSSTTARKRPQPSSAPTRAQYLIQTKKFVGDDAWPRQGAAHRPRRVGQGQRPAAFRAKSARHASRCFPAQLVLLAMGFLGPGESAARSSSASRTIRARQRQGGARQVRDQRAGRVRRRRHAPRPEPGRLGDQRRPRRRPRVRPLSDGRDAIAVIALADD